MAAKKRSGSVTRKPIDSYTDKVTMRSPKKGTRTYQSNRPGAFKSEAKTGRGVVKVSKRANVIRKEYTSPGGRTTYKTDIGRSRLRPKSESVLKIKTRDSGALKARKRAGAEGPKKSIPRKKK